MDVTDGAAVGCDATPASFDVTTSARKMGSLIVEHMLSRIVQEERGLWEAVVVLGWPRPQL